MSLPLTFRLQEIRCQARLTLVDIDNFAVTGWGKPDDGALFIDLGKDDPFDEDGLDRGVNPLYLDQDFNRLEVPFFVVVKIDGVLAIDQPPQRDPVPG